MTKRDHEIFFVSHYSLAKLGRCHVDTAAVSTSHSDVFGEETKMFDD
ncbi:MAG: hypothetical protein WCG55_04480 [bacterium]